MKTLFVTVLFGLLLSTASGSDVNIHAVVPEVHLKDGTVLQNVEFVSYAATSVMARWDGGRGTIPYAQLPDDVKAAMKEYIPEPPPPEVPIPDTIMEVPSPAPGPSTTVTGQVFIATKGGTSIKLPLVEVCVYPAEAWGSYQKQQEAIYTAKQKKLDSEQKAYEAANNYSSSLRTLNAELALSYDTWGLLPPPVASAKTDADGKFTITHTVVHPVIFARARRVVFGETEHYVWIILKVEPTTLLSNDNLSESNSY